MEEDDIVVVLDGWSCIIGIAEKLSKYNCNKNLSHCEPYNGDFLSTQDKILKWTEFYKWDKRRHIKPVSGFNNTLSIVDKDKKWWTSLINSNL